MSFGRFTERFFKSVRADNGKEKGDAPESGRQGNIDMLNNTNIPQRVYMKASEWANIPDNPRQRDTAKHAKTAKHLFTPHPIHALVNMATLPDGRSYKIDGHTRSYLWEAGKVPAPEPLIVDVWKCTTLEDVKNLYECFDNKGAAESSYDRMFGAYREHGVQFKSQFLASKKIASTMRMAYAFLHGGKEYGITTEYDLLQYWLNELYLLDECKPTFARFPSGIAWAALITFRRYGDQATDFWTRYASGLGNKQGSDRDAVEALTERVDKLRGERKLTSIANINFIGSLALSAFSADREGRGYTGGIRPLGKSTMAEWALATKQSKISGV